MHTLVVIAALVGTCIAGGGLGHYNHFSWDSGSAYGLCRAWGDTHFSSFDGARFRYQGTCTYVMSKVRCKGVDLEVAATNSEFRQGISQVSYVHVVINGDQIGFDGIGDTVQVNGNPETLPFKVPGMKGYIIYRGPLGRIRVGTKQKRGMLVTYHPEKHSLRIQLKRNCAARNKGICGTFDGNRMNDFETRNGVNVKHLNRPARSRKIVRSYWRNSPKTPGETKAMCNP